MQGDTKTFLAYYTRFSYEHVRHVWYFCFVKIKANHFNVKRKHVQSYTRHNSINVTKSPVDDRTQTHSCKNRKIKAFLHNEFPVTVTYIISHRSEFLSGWRCSNFSKWEKEQCEKYEAVHYITGIQHSLVFVFTCYEKLAAPGYVFYRYTLSGSSCIKSHFRGRGIQGWRVSERKESAVIIFTGRYFA